MVGACLVHEETLEMNKLLIRPIEYLLSYHRSRRGCRVAQQRWRGAVRRQSLSTTVDNGPLVRMVIRLTCSLEFVWRSPIA